MYGVLKHPIRAALSRRTRGVLETLLRTRTVVQHRSSYPPALRLAPVFRPAVPDPPALGCASPPPGRVMGPTFVHGQMRGA